MHVPRKIQTTIALTLLLAWTSGCAADTNSASPGKAEAVQSKPGASVHTVNGGNTVDKGTSASEAAGSVSGNAPQAAPETAAAKPSAPAAENETAHASQAGSAAQAPSSPASVPAETPKKLYRMNAVYSFVPINKGAAPSKVVLLTFDDGPKADKTLSSLLGTLDKHNAKAIFFVNGYRVKQHPELLKKIADRGQTIGNHSWDHIDLKKETEATVKKQIGDVQTIVKQVAGISPVFFRPPFGSGNDRVKGIVRDNGMLYMTWSDGSLDWDSSTKNKPDKVIANVLDQLHPGVNILMHELPWTAEALDSLLTKLEAKGYGFIDPATIDRDPDSSRQPSAK